MPVVVTVNGQAGPASSMSYNMPTLTSVTPNNGASGGNYNLTLIGKNGQSRFLARSARCAERLLEMTRTGTNFGRSAQVFVGVYVCDVWPGQVPSSPLTLTTSCMLISSFRDASQSHTKVVCKTRAGSGQNNPVTVNVGGQVSNSRPFSCTH